MKSRPSRFDVPALTPEADIDRLLSMPEYYHASLGRHPLTLERPRHITIVMEGKGAAVFDEDAWRLALARAAMANAGARLRLVGDSWRSRWSSDGLVPQLRVIEHCAWDGQSGAGAEFLDETLLSLTDGPTVELVVVRDSPRGMLVILRTLHAVMDGRGALHFARELFRGLRGEPLLGSNARFSDVDLMLGMGVSRSTSRHQKTTWLTGEIEGDARGDDWRRVQLQTSSKMILARTAAAMAAFAHQRSDLPAVIAVAVDLRRHLPGLHSTANFSSLLLVPLARGDGVMEFKDRLNSMLDARMDAYYPRVLNVFKLIPLRWFDRLLSRTPANYRKRQPLETALLSNLGRIEARDYGCPQFQLEDLYAIPHEGTFMSFLMGVGDRLSLSINMPRVLSGSGRFDLFVDHLHRHLAETEQAYCGSAQ